MNTTAAATEANVTVATIRTWCRIGAVAAVKTAGRWTIDAASLIHRIAIGRMRARKQTAMTQPAQPIEIDLGNGISIRAEQEASPAYGTTTWYAHKHVNGWKVGIPTDGATAEESIEAMRACIRQQQEQDAQIAAREESGLLADLTVGHLSGRLTPVGGNCHFCGLDARTCDCR